MQFRIIDHYFSKPKYGGISRQYDFAVELSKRGYNVVVLTSDFSHYTHTYIEESKDKDYYVSNICEGINYVYLHTRKYMTNGGIDRIS